MKTTAILLLFLLLVVPFVTISHFLQTRSAPSPLRSIKDERLRYYTQAFECTYLSPKLEAVDYKKLISKMRSHEDRVRLLSIHQRHLQYFANVPRISIQHRFNETHRFAK